ncbi:hypothetical protein Tco_0858530 [Tanacetum coccineum]|uniref:CCHC-type domain-containing protein n=1 Tax=Tanacetum coccineum TaxID=301880 RepID=A0ABQ5BCD2_9ASTR
MTTAQNENADQGGPALKCDRCELYHFGRCPIKYSKCEKVGHKAKDCRGKAIATGANTQLILVCYECGERGHARNRYPKRDNQRGEGARSNKSFVNTSFSHLFEINPVRQDTSQIPIRCTPNTLLETVDVSEESEPEPEPVKRKTASRRVVKKKVIISTDDNIISDDLDVALELGKSISKTEAEEAEAARQVHATHARIVTESVPESAKKKTSSRSLKSKLKGVQSLNPTEKEATDIMQALKESKKTSKRQTGTRGSSEGTGTIPGFPGESTVVSATSSEGTGTKQGVPDEEKDITKENVILEWGSEQESEYSKEDQHDDEEKDDKEGDVDDEYDETESDENDIYKYKIHVRDEEVTDVAKADAEKTSKVKDDAKKTELPSISSSLSVSSGFGDQFIKLSSDSSLVSTVKDTTDA